MAEKERSSSDTCMSSGERSGKWMARIWALLVSITGGLLLGFWECNYHQTNSQLWMVPFGLILLTTPIIIWFALSVSDICISYSKEGQEEDDHHHHLDSMESQRVK
ncbi:hypothetical protein ACFE04_016768 [Oxalis oulophora]